jgi:hypothetical protein
MSRPLRRCLAFLSGCLVATLALAQDGESTAGSAAAPAPVQVEGQTFDAHAEVGGATLKLNGVGLRAVAWLKGYAAALYIGERTRSVEAVLADRGAKRLQLRMLVDAPSEVFVKGFERGVARNRPPGGVATLKERMARFDRTVLALEKVRKGDIVDLDYLPGSGMVLSFNGKPRGEPIPGADLYEALLSVFIGPKPVDAELKAGLLGGPVG